MILTFFVLAIWLHGNVFLDEDANTVYVKEVLSLLKHKMCVMSQNMVAGHL